MSGVAILHVSSQYAHVDAVVHVFEQTGEDSGAISVRSRRAGARAQLAPIIEPSLVRGGVGNPTLCSVTRASFYTRTHLYLEG